MKDTSSIYLGVYKTHNGIWRVKSRLNNNHIFLGAYNSEIAAAYAYNKYVITISEYATLNELNYTTEYLENLLVISKPIKSEGTSKQNGVHWSSNKKRWIARININGKKKDLGCFINEIDAINKRLEYEKLN